MLKDGRKSEKRGNGDLGEGVSLGSKDKKPKKTVSEILERSEGIASKDRELEENMKATERWLNYLLYVTLKADLELREECVERAERRKKRGLKYIR